jgi:photosystem II PsbT protein
MISKGFIQLYMESIVYAFLLIATLGIIFFAIFFREPPRIIKLSIQQILWRTCNLCFRFVFSLSC